MLDGLAGVRSVAPDGRAGLVVDIDGTARTEVVAALVRAGVGRRPGGAAAPAGGRVPGPGRRRHERRLVSDDVRSTVRASGYRASADAVLVDDRAAPPGEPAAHPDRAGLHGGAAADHPGRVRVRRRRRRRRQRQRRVLQPGRPGHRRRANFALFTLLVGSSFLLVVVVALFFGDTVASEASWGSLRYLLAIPVPRARLLGVKLVASLLYSALALVLLVGTALLAGTLRYGWNPLRSTIADQLTAGEALGRVARRDRLHRTDAARGRHAGVPAVGVDRRPARRGRRRGAAVHPVEHPRPDRGARRDPELPADPLQRRLAGPALHPGADRRDGARRDLGVAYAALFCGLAFWRFLRKDIVS